jgi:hypothetical protein
MADHYTAPTQVSSPAPLTLQRDVQFRSSQLLTAVRFGWLFLIIATSVVLLVSYPAWYSFTIATMSPAVVATMATIGVTPQGYAVYIVIINGFLSVFSIAAAALLFLRKSDNWMVLVISLGMVIFIGAPNFVFSPVMAQPHLALKIPAATLLIIGNLCVMIVLFLFPDGRFYPAWQRWVFLFGLIWEIVTEYISYLASPSSGAVFQGVLLTITLIALYGQARRYRQAAAPQQQQTKWMLFGIAIAVGGSAISFIAETTIRPNLPDPSLALYWMIMPLVTGCIPLAILLMSFVFSMMRYRLWEVDIFINRSLVTGTMTLVLGVLFFGASAPEQILSAREVIPSADIYALGIMTYQMLTGRLPFEGGNPAVLVFAHLQKPAPDPCSVVPTIPAYAALAVLRALEKDPAGRFASAGEFAAALE